MFATKYISKRNECVATDLRGILYKTLCLLRFINSYFHGVRKVYVNKAQQSMLAGFIIEEMITLYQEEGRRE